MANKSLFKTFREMKDDERKKLIHTIVITLSVVFFVVGISLAFFSCKSQPSAYESYSVPIDWKAVLKDSTWLVDSGALDYEDIPTALRKLSKLVFLSNDGNSWTCRIETSTAQTDECTVSMNDDKGFLVYGTCKLDVHLSENDNSYFMRLTASGSRTVDLALKK